ncbi:MAG TPA: hypothetical protein VM901_04940 [Bdellovibrionota bacterium]|nr:hypothetical protein [Bdellovibrionota bacterium]
MNADVLKKNWKLVEFVDLGSDSLDAGGTRIMQLFHYKVEKENLQENSLWLLAGFYGPAKGDSTICSLLQKAITKNLFSVDNELFLTPSIFSKTDDSAPEFDISCHNFAAEGAMPAASTPHGASTLMKWFKLRGPRAIITFSVGQPFIRVKNCPDFVVDSLRNVSERSVYEFGTEPQVLDIDGITQLPREPIDTSFANWCTAQGASWIDFSVDNNLKSFDELVQQEWKTAIGPALKWLIEGPRFNPPKEETGIESIEIVPVLEMPPEFANL